MPTLDQIPVEEVAVHLLLIADTKMGKSTYAAHAAAAGFRVIYIDSDNGITAIHNALKKVPDVMKRIHYVGTAHPAIFMRSLIHKPNTVLRWNTTRDKEFTRQDPGDPDDNIFELTWNKIPHQIIFILDSWSSLASDAMGLGAAARHVELIEMGNAQQGVYGDANIRLTEIANAFQKARFHCIVQAHETVYERYERPPGKAQRDIKQGEMILKESTKIPISSSRPHGFTLGKYFNHIGWIEATRTGETEIDFTRTYDRVGGGPPNRRASTKELSFARLADPSNAVVPADPGPDGWTRDIKSSELVASLPAPNALLGAAKSPSLAKPTVPAPKSPAIPSKGATLGNLKLATATAKK